MVRRLALCGILLASLPACERGAQPVAVACPPNPLLGVYDPSRLTVLKPCVWFEGTVVSIDKKDDGDMHLLLSPAAGSETYLNARDVKEGGMVTEVVPGQTLPIPAVGAHVQVFGTWVLDAHNGWNEMHPVWEIKDLDRHTTSYALPPQAPIYSGG